MDLVLVLLLVLIGVGAIVYAGLRQPAAPAEPIAGREAAAGDVPGDRSGMPEDGDHQA